jgi:uncharacterized protein YkwD
MTRAQPALALLLLITGCGADAPDSPGERPDLDETAFQRSLLDAHDLTRANASPTPANPLPPLQWDDAVAAVAQEWAERCVFEHRQPNNFGENLALFSDPEVSPEAVVQIWADEAPFYDYDGNDCAAGEQCGHYTQIVWADTTKLGCGVAVCDDVAGFGPGALWVCNYDPPGNFVGQRPY